MDLLNVKIKPTYFKYLAAAFGSALITSIYSIVDMAMVGQYQGPDGTAALAVVAPVWNIIYSLGLLMGIGGSVTSVQNAEAPRKATALKISISPLQSSARSFCPYSHGLGYYYLNVQFSHSSVRTPHC